MNKMIDKIQEINQHIDIISDEVKEVAEVEKNDINSIVQEVDELLSSIRQKIAKLHISE